MIVNVLPDGGSVVEVVQDGLPNIVEVVNSSAPSIVEVIQDNLPNVVEVFESSTSYNVEILQDSLPNVVEVLEVPTPNVVEVITAGPMGPMGPPGDGYIDPSLFVTTASFNFYTGSSISRFAGTASFATTAKNILGGKATHLPFFITDTTLATSSIYQSGSYSIIINQDSNTPGNPEALYVWQPHPTSFNIISGKGNLNNYAQLNVFNTNTGDNASSDIVATADNGSETTNYIDMGINGSGFTGDIGNANDAYLYSAGQHLHIGNTNPTKPVQFFVGGADTDLYRKFELNANGQHNMTGSLEISGSLVVNQGITGSLFGTSSYAATASIGPGTINYLPKFTSTTTIGNSLLQDNGTNIITGNNNFLVGNNWKIFYDSSNSIKHNSANGWNITSWLDTRFFIGNESNEIMRLTNAGLRLTGSLDVTQGITGSLLGTASYVTGSIFTGTNPALTSSYALTASYALNAGGGGSPFPYTGSALITGSLGVTGSVSISGSATYNLDVNGNSNVTGYGLFSDVQTANLNIDKIALYKATGNDYTIRGFSYGGVLSLYASYLANGAKLYLYGASNAIGLGSIYTPSKVGIGTINTSSAILSIAGTTILSGSSGTVSGSTLTVVGSGSSQPVFTVQGSQGELFSVTDSLSGSLFSVNDISGLPVLEVFSDNTTLVGNYQAPALITTAKKVLTNSGSFSVYAVPTASYDGAFFEYTIRSGSNARAGQIMAMWSGSSVNYTEMTTTNFGITSGVTFGVFISGSNMVLTGSASTSAWTVKSIVRSI